MIVIVLVAALALGALADQREIDGEICTAEFPLAEDELIKINNETGFQMFVGMPFPKSGTLKGWRFYASRTDLPIYVGVFRKWHIWVDRVGVKKIQPKTKGMTTVDLEPSEYIDVSKGDFIGIHYPSDQWFFGHKPFSDDAIDQGVINYRQGHEDSKILILKNFGQDEWVSNGDWSLDVEEESAKVAQAFGQPAIEAVLCPDGRTTPNPPVEATNKPPHPEDKECVFPFHYYGKTFNTCIKNGEEFYWCSTDEAYAGSFKKCDSRDRVPEKMDCQFPFTYKGHSYDTCQSDNNKQPWCVVGSGEFEGENWRNCRRDDKQPRLEPCHLPFTYNGETYDKCTAIGTKKPWCSTTSDYTEDSWRYCTEVEIKALTRDLSKTHKDADNQCWLQDMILATEQEIRHAYDLGQQQCNCGWADNGKAYKIIQANSNCGEPGVHECQAGKAIPFCVKNPDNWFNQDF